MTDRLGDYKLISRIGAGGMGEVWRAENIHTRVACALKLLPEAAASDQNFVSRFFDEGRLMQTLEHPHIVRVHHVGHDAASNRYFLVMDLIESDEGRSCSLHDLLASAPDNRLPETDVRRWSLQVADALAHAHAQGVIHRDIKPANVLIDRDGNARVTDFGLAKAVGEEYLRSQIHTSIAQSMAGRSMGSLHTAKPPEANAPGAERSIGELPTMDTGRSPNPSHGRTTADALLGTYDYMAPEQRGDLDAPVGPATDVYAFGVMLYRLLTGRRPAGMAKPVSQVVPRLSKAWDRICARCLEHPPADRYADGAALKRDLALIAGKSRPWKWVAALFLLAAAAGGYWAYQNQPEPPASATVDPAVPETRSAVADTAAEDAARRARDDSQSARDAAVDVQAARDARSSWEEAERLQASAGSAFADGDFMAAARDWRSATTVYNRARNRALDAQAEQERQHAAAAEQRRRDAEAEAERRAAEERARQNRPQEGRDWPLASLGLTMKWIPPGTFMMGSTRAEREWAADPKGGKGEASWFTDEREPVEVRIARGFWLGQTTITRAMFRRFVEAENYRTEAERDGRAWTMDSNFSAWGWQDGKNWRDPGFEQQDTHPAVCITWNDAKAFCDWLTRTERAAGRIPEGYEYRLPGEAEWEYAARGGRPGSTKFWWGDNLADGRGRLNGAGTDRLPTGLQWANRYDWDDGFAFTSPVDHYGARGRNGFGLADMLGNVWEWCYDGYDSNGPHPTIWQGDTSRRVLRGGSFNNQPGNLRCANRDRNRPTNPNANNGFRLCLGVVVR